MKIDLTTYKNILDKLLYEGIYITDCDRKIMYWNKGAERITGYKSSEVIGKHCWDNILMHVNDRGDQICKGICPLAKTVLDGQNREAHVYLHHKDGHRIPIKVRVEPLIDSKGQSIMGAVEIFSDSISQMGIEQRIQELEKMSLIDQLTQIGNRRYLAMNLQSRHYEMQRYGWPFGVLFVDIDHFKKINDRYGHAIGDKVLKMVADTLKYNLRSFDLLGRWGGEEFIAIAVNVDKNLLSSIAHRMLVLVEQSILILGSDNIRVTVSIGATLAEPEDTVETLLERADDLMYQSKADGRNRVTIQQTS